MPELSHARCPCRGCGKVANTAEEVEILFGIRNMGDGRTIVQSYCRECRGLHCEAGDPKCNKS